MRNTQKAAVPVSDDADPVSTSTALLLKENKGKINQRLHSQNKYYLYISEAVMVHKRRHGSLFHGSKTRKI
jgi:hypothetical protein